MVGILAMSPDENVFQAHLLDGPFLNGVDRGKWRCISIEWPFVLIAVSAAPRDRSPNEFVFRFRCDNYPQEAPTAQPWDLEQNIALEARRWPGGRSRVPAAFRPEWKDGQCLYLPCDRIAYPGHDGWNSQHPQLIWKASSDITLYLEVVYELLNSSDYTGPRSP
jgi:hypothetical protein